MTLTLELPPDLCKRLEAEVHRSGLPAEQVARAALEAGLGGAPAQGPRPEDWKGRIAAAEEEFKDLLKDVPTIPLDALRRENLYADDGL